MQIPLTVCCTYVGLHCCEYNRTALASCVTVNESVSDKTIRATSPVHISRNRFVSMRIGEMCVTVMEQSKSRVTEPHEKERVVAWSFPTMMYMQSLLGFPSILFEVDGRCERLLILKVILRCITMLA